jgi:hypothetical protein
VAATISRAQSSADIIPRRGFVGREEVSPTEATVQHYMCASRSIKVSVKRVHVYMCTPTYQRVYRLCQCLHPW